VRVRSACGLVLAALVATRPGAAAGVSDLSRNHTSVHTGSAPGVTGIDISQNHATAHIALPGDIGLDLDLSFEQCLGLTAESLGISASLVDPASLSLVQRLPASTSIPAAFPVKIAIEPPASGPLAFSGIVSIDLHTHNLAYTAPSPFRFYAAEAGGSFQDITSSIGLGSYRTGGSKGGFSEFLVVADARPIDAVIQEKFQRLQTKLDAASSLIPGPVLASLQAQLSSARNTYLANDALGAADGVQQFADGVRQNSGEAIPDVWRSARDVPNVAGDLRGSAATLKFSLLMKANGGS